MKKTVKDYLHFANPTKDQITVLDAMNDFVQKENKDQFLIIRGAAGTGKTSIVSALVGYLNENKSQYQIAAPTGRAARIIGKKVGASASTVHSMIFIPETDKESGKITFQLKIHVDEQQKIYIIDEASMLPSKSRGLESNFGSEHDLLSSIIQFIFNANTDNKVIFIGDSYQLPPVGEEISHALEHSFLAEKYNLIGMQFSLTEVKRQEDGSYILQNATSIREAIDQGANSHSISGYKSRSIYTASQSYTHNLKANGPENNVAIGVSHKANNFFNDLVRTNLYGKNKKILEPGDLMMVTRNWSRNGAILYNGDQIEILEIDWGSIETVCELNFVAIKFRPIFSDEVIEDLLLIETVTSLGARVDNEKEVKLLQSRYIKNRLFRESENPEDDKYLGAIKLMYGHSITCHKAQGGEWNKVYINTWGIPGLKWQYTAVTRGVKQIEHF